MKKIPSFTIDHIHLLRGIYVSRKDEVGGETVTTFDVRMKEPNRDGKLPADEGGLAVGGYCGTDERNVPFHCGI